MEEGKESSVELNKGGVPSQRGLYAKLAGNSDLFMEKLLLMVESRNENVVVSALKIAFDRLLPALKSLEVSGEDHGPIRIIIVDDGNRNPIADQKLPEAAVDI